MNKSSPDHLDEPLWYKDAIIYEVHVRSFCDSNGDGVGDFPGLTSKLDYLQELGITAIWLLPFYPSPLKDDGYDIASYLDVHPSYGTLREFHTFLREAHRRGLRVITELVVNHTSDQHPWFQRARRSPPGSKMRDFYVWSDTVMRYQDARIIFKDFEHSNWTWDPVARAYFWHRFYSHQPDLNFDAPHVRRSVMQVLDFWMGLGVDGMRLDAVPYLFEREGTHCENLPETHAYLRELRAHVDRKFRNRLLLAEANQWPEDAIAYFGAGDECHMCFHFPLMPRLFMAMQQEDSFPIMEILQQTPSIPSNCQWALFLRNHDELTLEMVTDEERDYMYRVYAMDKQARINLGIRRRLAPLLGNNRRKIEQMKALLMSLPGTPVLYYGDELGMGDNFYLGDRNGVRTPMQWSADRNAGFSRGNPQRLFLPIIIDPEYHYEAINVEAQQNNPQSLLWWIRRLLTLRKRHRAFGSGTLEFLKPENPRILAFIRRSETETILVVANLSRFAQHTTLDLSEWKGFTPLELFGSTRFPVIGDSPVFLPLAEHGFFWFLLEPPHAGDITETSMQPRPVLEADNKWEELLARDASEPLTHALASWLRERRWFGAKAHAINQVFIADVVRMPMKETTAYLVFTRIEFLDTEPQTYVLPLTVVHGEEAAKLGSDHPRAIIANVHIRSTRTDGLLVDALLSRASCHALLDAVVSSKRLRSHKGALMGRPSRTVKPLRGATIPEPTVCKAEQSNSAVVYGDQFFLKLIRHIEPGINPDVEVSRFLTDKARFPHMAPWLGTLEYQSGGSDPCTVAMLSTFVPNQGDAWQFTLNHIDGFLEAARARRSELEDLPPFAPVSSTLFDARPHALVLELVGSYVPLATLLGRRTAELHLALASQPEDPVFAPEPFTPLYQRSIYQTMRSRTARAVQLLRKALKGLPDPTRQDAQRLLERESGFDRFFRKVVERPLQAVRLRVHGDFHLGQVLFTGKDFIIIDFEGEPANALSQRRLKRSPLRDVAGMLRSFHYAAHAAYQQQMARGMLPNQANPEPLRWMNLWFHSVGALYLQSYLETALQGGLIRGPREDLHRLFDALLLEKAVYELSYELNNRPQWVGIPLTGILHMLESGDA